MNGPHLAAKPANLRDFFVFAAALSTAERRTSTHGAMATLTDRRAAVTGCGRGDLVQCGSALLLLILPRDNAMPPVGGMGHISGTWPEMPCPGSVHAALTPAPATSVRNSDRVSLRGDRVPCAIQQHLPLVHGAKGAPEDGLGERGGGGGAGTCLSGGGGGRGGGGPGGEGVQGRGGGGPGGRGPPPSE